MCSIDLCQNGSVAAGFLEERDRFKGHTVYEWLIGEVSPSKVIQRYKDSRLYYIPADDKIDSFIGWTEQNLSPIKQLKSVSTKIKPLKDMFDFIIFDTHPNENSKLVHYAVAASDFSLIPFCVDIESKMGGERAAEVVMDFNNDEDYGFNIDFAFVPNRVSRRNGVFRTQLEKMIKDMKEKGYEDKHFLSEIRESDLVTTTKNDGIMLLDSDKGYARKVLEDFEIMTSELLERLDVVSTHEEVMVNE